MLLFNQFRSHQNIHFQIPLAMQPARLLTGDNPFGKIFPAGHAQHEGTFHTSLQSI